MKAGSDSRRGHLGLHHPVAEVAGRLCQAHLGRDRRSVGLGQVACGACWEQAIRDDERFALVFGLPREIVPDPDYVDEIAVERACRGEHVRLTRAELAAAVARLHRAGQRPGQIAARLRRAHGDVNRAVRALVAVPAAAAMPAHADQDGAGVAA